jgi:hypothetical protein
MEDAIRDAVIKLGGPLPVIGFSIVIAAIAFWFAYISKDNDRVLATLGVVVGVGALLFAFSSYPVAQASCRNLAQRDYKAYEKANCLLIVSCSPLNGTCTS